MISLYCSVVNATVRLFKLSHLLLTLKIRHFACENTTFSIVRHEFLGIVDFWSSYFYTNTSGLSLTLLLDCSTIALQGGARYGDGIDFSG